jgi:threonine dehydrogenase-like Zn-dependent dehydrogenase
MTAALNAPPPPVTPRRTMRAACVVEPGRVELVEAPVPEPSHGQIRVRVQGCGVCASNIPPYEGRDWFAYPLAPGQLGHEGWGVVDAVGDGVTAFRSGDRVAMLSLHAFAEFDIVDATHAMPIPAESTLPHCPAEPIGCAANIFERSEIRAGQTVAIIGIGYLGAVLTRLCTAAGARVIAVSRRGFSLDVARDMGAESIVQLTDDTYDAIQRVASLTNGTGGYEVGGFCDRVIECTGKQQALDLAGEISAVRGRVVIAGYHQDGLRQINMQLWNWRGLDVINAHEREPARYVTGMQHAIELATRGTLDIDPLHTHILPLDRLGDAFELTRRRPDGFIKAIVTV